MKKIILLFLASLVSGFVAAASALPDKASIHFVLSHIDKGSVCPEILNNASVLIEYDYNFERNMGLAYLKQLKETSWTEVLHPLGLRSMYGFMSDMAPKTIQLNGGEVVVYRILFNIHFNGDSQIMLMLGEHGDCIMSSDRVNVNNL